MSKYIDKYYRLSLFSWIFKIKLDGSNKNYNTLWHDSIYICVCVEEIFKTILSLWEGRGT